MKIASAIADGALRDDTSAQAPPDPSGDRALVDRLLAGDAAAFDQLVERYDGRLTRLACMFVSTEASAEEVVQEAWIGVLEGVARFEWRSSFKTWLFTILTHKAKARGVRDGRSRPFSSLDDPSAASPAVAPERFRADGHWADPPQAWDAETPERILARRQSLQLLGRALEGLPEKQRLVVTLHDIEGLEPEEICRVLEIAESHQRVLLHRARCKLRSVLEAHLREAE